MPAASEPSIPRRLFEKAAPEGSFRRQAYRLGLSGALAANQPKTPSNAETTHSPKVVIIGDIGNQVYHLGDEAMTEATIQELNARGITDITVIANNPEAASKFYNVPAVPRYTFTNQMSVSEVEARLDALANNEYGADGPDPRTVAAIRNCDALILAGGGVLVSLYPKGTYERISYVRLAQKFGKPVILLSQTIGPTLTGYQEELVKEIVNYASFVALREDHSLDFVATLAPQAQLVHTVDDAFTLEPGLADIEYANSLHLPPRFIVASFGGHRRGEFDGKRIQPWAEHIAMLADGLQRIVAATDCDIVLVPHMENLDPSAQPEADQVLNNAIVDYANNPRIRAIPTATALQATEITKRAQLVVGSRYHSIIMGLATGVPVLGLAQSDYNQVKISGALKNAGITGLAISDTVWDSPGIGLLANQLIKSQKLRALLRENAATRISEHQRWWDNVANWIYGKPFVPQNLKEVPQLTIDPDAYPAISDDVSPAPLTSTPTKPRPDVSVIIPLYNAEPWLAQCIESVQAQTGVNLEIICINDGSRDGTAQLAAGFAANDARIRVINQPNSGLPAARDVGIENATGRYLVFLDQDDFWVSDSLKDILAVAERDNLDVTWFEYQMHRDSTIDDEYWELRKNRIKPRTAFTDQAITGPEYLELRHNSGEYQSMATFNLIKSDFLANSGVRFIPGLWHEDNPFTFQLLLAANRTADTRIQFYSRRVRAGSIMSDFSFEKSLVGYYKCAIAMLNSLAKYKLSGETLGAATWIALGPILMASEIYQQNPQLGNTLINETFNINQFRGNPTAAAVMEILPFVNIASSPGNLLPTNVTASHISERVLPTYLLLPDSYLAPDKPLVSANGRFRLLFDSGDIVIHDGDQPVFTTGGLTATKAVFQGDGNLVLYKDDEPVWNTGTVGPGRTLVLQDDGSAAIFDENDEVVFTLFPGVG